jgi:hypothetical protein
MAMRAPFARQICGKADGAAKTTALSLHVRFHLIVLSPEK